MCLCSVAAGVLATRIDGAASAARVRQVFVVLDGIVLAAFYPFYWSVVSIEQVGGDGDLHAVSILVLIVPALVAFWLTLYISQSVHKVVLAAYGPIVPDAGDGAPAQRIRVLGSVLVGVGVSLTVAAAALALTSSVDGFQVFVVILMALVPVLLGVSLTRAIDVYSARRRNVIMYLIVTGSLGISSMGRAYDSGTVSAGLLGALVVGAIVLIVVAFLVLREYADADEWNRPWRERLWGAKGGVSRGRRAAP